jgi:hypothetical protein
MRKKTVSLMLAFVMMSAACVNAQVRIGGDVDPNESAVLDLNATDNPEATGSLGLALPRVKLVSTTISFPLNEHVRGMMVYNTANDGDVVQGVYYNDGKKWIMTGHGTLATNPDESGLTVTNPTTTDDPYTVAIKDGGVTTAKIAGGAVTTVKIINDAVTTEKILDGTVGTADLAANAVTEIKIAANAVTTPKIYDKAVTTAKIADGAVDTDKLAAEAVTADKLDDMGAATNDVLAYNGSAWTPTALSSSAYSGGGGSAPCTGAIVYGGAYNGSMAKTYPNNMGTHFEPNWSNSLFSIQGKDLCWAPTDISGKKNWEEAEAACAALTTDNRLWRLPNLKELQVLYEAIGGKGGPVTALTALDTYGYGVSNNASAMQSHDYWSSTDLSSGAYTFDFTDGARSSNGQSLTFYVRCVRSL